MMAPLPLHEAFRIPNMANHPNHLGVFKKWVFELQVQPSTELEFP